VTSIALPSPGGQLAEYRMVGPREWPEHAAPATSRVAFAAAHVVADPLADNAPGAPAVLDWESTLAFRDHLTRQGLGIAEAMDTAQRGMGLTWDTAAELIRRSSAQTLAAGGRIACGVGTDSATEPPASLADVVSCYLQQLAMVEEAGAQAILMASRDLARIATSPGDYTTVYSALLREVGQPAILHWLGPIFDPVLAGYWGSVDVAAATGSFLDLVHSHAEKIDGVKVSLLDADHEIALRASLPEGVRLYTGDDFNYPALIESGSHALLGIFDPIAPAAAAAIRALDQGDTPAFHRALDDTVPLARHLFGAPTYFYKTGIVFLAWLNGHQPGFRMVGGLESARSILHLAEAFRLADQAGLLRDPDLAVQRMSHLLAVQGVGS
jgi:uncharacterized protein DUF993